MTPQHETARAKANRVRLIRAETKAWLKSLPQAEARAEWASMLEHGVPSALRTLSIDAALRYCRGLTSPNRVDIAARADLFVTERLGDLTEEQRWQLADALRQDQREARRLRKRAAA